ncbi:MAG TPA: FtsQ-type POTRA domain-containing protein [Streptosporangiaceae bacterium]|nr:FtsQ-type POTRA domain-containing protein [Streptosporangiaceae bacterium]
MTRRGGTAGDSGATMTSQAAMRLGEATSQPGSASGGPAARRPARRPGDPWRAAFLVVLGLAIVIGAAWALLGSSLLVVRHVQVTGNRKVPAAEVRAASGIQRGTPLARLNAAAAAHRIERIAWVLSARVSRSWPDTVVISIRERTPALAVASAGGFNLVDVNGVVVAQVARRPAGLPLLGSNTAPAGLRGSPAVRAAALVTGQLPGSIRQQVTSVTATAADAVTLHLRGRITVLWGSAARTPTKVRELRALMRTSASYYDVSSPRVAVTAG